MLKQESKTRKKQETKTSKKQTRKNVNSSNKLVAYLRNFVIFFIENILKKTGILLVVAILLIAIMFKFSVNNAKSLECTGTCMDNLSFISVYWSNIKALFVTGVSGIVPYLFIPVIAFVQYVVIELSTLSLIIKGYGYLAGITMGIVPLVLNILCYAIVAALAIYICKNNTLSFRITNLKNMNFLNFRIKVYEVMQNEAKIKKLTDKKEEKLKKLEERKEKLNYIQILNTAILVSIIQVVSVLVQTILL